MFGPAVLDVTRLVSRLGKGALTGIDRVELAYLEHLPNHCDAVFGLIRTPAGVLLLDVAGLKKVHRWANGAPFPNQRDFLSRLFRKDPMIGAVETALRQDAVARMTLGNMPRRLASILGKFVYFNVGHSNLSEKFLTKIRKAGGRIVVMIHDVIPLDYPQFARADQSPVFERKLRAVSKFADAVIHLTYAESLRTEHWLQLCGRVPPGIVAALGVPIPLPEPKLIPSDLPINLPYFVMVGTVEPRKNHQLILDLWAELPEPAPQLFILGNKGWATSGLLDRLVRPPANVHFRSGLSDGAVAALVLNARALLFPSFAEGFGLPPYEAAALGTPVIASDISVTREGLGDYPVYVEGTDSYSWRETILSHCAELSGKLQRNSPRQGPTWGDHFKVVLSNLWNGR